MPACMYTLAATHTLSGWTSLWMKFRFTGKKRGQIVKAVCAQSHKPSLPDRLASNRGQPRDRGGVPASVRAPAGQAPILKVLNVPLTLSVTGWGSLSTLIHETFSYLCWCWLTAFKVQRTFIKSVFLKEHSDILGNKCICHHTQR